MIKTYAQLQTYLAARKGFDSFSRLDAAQQTVAKDMLNLLRDTIWYHKQWGFAGRDLQFTTVPPYASGTVSGTAGDNTLTGSSTSWPSHANGVPLVGQLLVINDKAYIIRKIVSTSSLRIVGQLTETVAAGSAYAIYFVKYPTRRDIGAFRSVVRDVTPIEFRPGEISPLDNEVGEPLFLFAEGQTEVDYESGTGTFTLGSDEVTSVSGVTLTDNNLIGKSIMIASDPVPYYIIDVDSATSKIYLDRTFKGATVSGGTFTVDPVGTPVIGVRPYPTSRNLIRVKYTKEVPQMVGDNDLTGLPNDVPMLTGIDVITTKWETVGERGFINEVLFQDKKFIDSMKVLNTRGTPLQTRLYSMYDRQIQGGKIRTNPWNSFGAWYGR